jgi:hypothetical protein
VGTGRRGITTKGGRASGRSQCHKFCRCRGRGGGRNPNCALTCRWERSIEGAGRARIVVVRRPEARGAGSLPNLHAPCAPPRRPPPGRTVSEPSSCSVLSPGLMEGSTTSRTWQGGNTVQKAGMTEARGVGGE